MSTKMLNGNNGNNNNNNNSKLRDERDEAKLIAQQLTSNSWLTHAQRHCLLHSRVMQTFVLDISELTLTTNDDHDVMSGGGGGGGGDNEVEPKKRTARWQTPIAQFSHAPPDTILYSLAPGLDEIIMFGGMEVESSPSLSFTAAAAVANNVAVNGANGGRAFGLPPQQQQQQAAVNLEANASKHRVSNRLFIMKPIGLFISTPPPPS